MKAQVELGLTDRPATKRSEGERDTDLGVRTGVFLLGLKTPTVLLFGIENAFTLGFAFTLPT